MLSSSIHSASLVDPTLHSPALLQLVHMDMSRSLIEYLVDTVSETVDYAMGRPSSSVRGRTLSRHSEHSKFTKFVSDVLTKAEVKVPALLVTLVYIERAKPHIQIALEQWANERVFLGALILANKYLNDSTLKNVHWALCTGVFGKRDIGRIEREFLDVLDFELSVSEADLLAHHDALLALPRTHHPHPSSRLPTREHHKRHAHRTSSPPGSRWSTDSSEMDVDVDSESSFESVSLPRTPEPLSLPSSSSASSSAAAATVPFPTKAETEELDFSANPHFASHHQQHQHHHQHQQLHSHSHSHSQTHSHHRVRASALSILRSFPLPHFHSQPHLAATPAAQAYHHPLAPHAMPIRA